MRWLLITWLSNGYFRPFRAHRVSLYCVPRALPFAGMFWPLRGDAPARIGHLQDGLFAPEATPTACHIGAKGNALEPRPTTNTPALKGRNMVLPPIRSLSVTVVMASWCFVVSPFQGWSCSCGSCFQGVALRWDVLAPAGRGPGTYRTFAERPLRACHHSAGTG